MNDTDFMNIAINLNDPEWILKHINIALRRASNDRLVKKPCDLEGIEQYLIIKAGCCSVKVIPMILTNADIKEDLAWKRAMENLRAETQITSLEQTLADMIGPPYSHEEESGMDIHIISNTHKCMGAASIMDRQALRSFANAHNTDMLFVIPSSVHEMMLIPYNSSISLDDLSAMVKEVNETQVLPEERLTDRAYIINL